MAQSIRTKQDYEDITYDYLTRCAAEGSIYEEMIAWSSQGDAVGGCADVCGGAAGHLRRPAVVVRDGESRAIDALNPADVLGVGAVDAHSRLDHQLIWRAHAALLGSSGGRRRLARGRSS